MMNAEFTILNKESGILYIDYENMSHNLHVQHIMAVSASPK